MFATVNDVIAVKNTVNSSAVLSFEDELILLRKTEFSVEFCLVRAVYNFDSRLFTDCIPNTRRAV
jgi:hypothetical protein